ncbi:MAG: hypothetical protein HYS87_03745 [Candidatus Colwellbacteria bacterium]|nr:hypothetical protein [Candidatus Colwellbacteria bacterium]
MLGITALGGALFAEDIWPREQWQPGPEPAPEAPVYTYRYIKERSVADRPDDVLGEKQIHAVYVLPSDGEDKGYDTSGAIAVSMESGERWLENQTDGRRLRLDTWNGMLDVSFYRFSRTEAELEKTPGLMYEELRLAGFNTTNKLYAVHYGASGPFCGISESVSWAIVYLYNCGDPRDPFAPQLESFREERTTGIFHEIFHSLGAVPSCAPHKSGESHVSDSPQDLMYNYRLPGPLPDPEDPIVLDFGRDDYYGHGRDDCPDVAKSPFWQDGTA